MPLTVQRQIANKFPLIAYGPRKVPAGFRYTQYFAPPPGGFVLQFHRRGAPSWDEISFSVGRRSHPGCPLNGTKLSVDGVAVDWSGTDVLEQAARCVTVGHTYLMVAASRAEPIHQADALKLAHMVAQIRRLR